jgi:hypothetical protein
MTFYMIFRALTGLLRGALYLAFLPLKLRSSSKPEVKASSRSAAVIAAQAYSTEAKLDLAAEMDAFTEYLNENAEMLAEHPEQARVANAYRAILLSRSEALRV